MPMIEACLECLRRSWLLARLGARLDRRRRDPQLLWDLLLLPDESLIEAIGGRRRAELTEERLRFDRSASAATPDGGAHAVCRHHARYPSCLTAGLAAAGVTPGAPWPCLYALGRLDGIGNSLAGGVAIVGTRHASDYGMHVAHTLARDLALAGVAVGVVFAEGIAFAALSGALQAGGAPLAMMAGSIDRCSPASCVTAYRRLASQGCLLAQLPPGSASRRWSALVACRTVLLASAMTVVVELERDAGELACVELARAQGKPLGAVPGRLTSPAAAGANDLLRAGATLVRDVHDVLGALHGVDVADTSPGMQGPPSGMSAQRPGPRLGAHAQATLHAIDAGNDTLAKLAQTGVAHAETVLALAELELHGMLVRGDGGRYLPSLGSSPAPNELSRFEDWKAR